MSAASSSLIVYAVSDSFGALWPLLAEEMGLTLELTSSIDHFTNARDAVGIVSGGGDETLLISALREIAPPAIEIAAVGADDDRRIVVSAIRAGAADYFVLTSDLELLRAWVREQAERIEFRRRRSAFADNERDKYRFDGILGESPALIAALDRAARVIPHASVTVLVSGETGTGKELLARALHYNGPRREAPFVDVNCAAIPEHLLESELFGHEKGAFTSASSAKPGLFEVADGGTIFLDEIGHLPMMLQSKLLRVLQERQIRRVGGTRSVPIDVKVVAATHVNLAEAVRQKTFREDLYYRLNVVPLDLPPLRARADDIIPLAKHFLATFAAEYNVRVPSLLPGAQRALRQRAWPGNVRELRNAMERAVLLSDGRALDATDVELSDPETSSASNGIPFPAPLAEVIVAASREMVALCGGNKSEAARRLGISRTRLQRHIDHGTDTIDSPADVDLRLVGS